MNFTPNYIFINKIFKRISHYRNWVYIFLPIRWLVLRSGRNEAVKLNRGIFVQRLRNITGDFQDFPDSLRGIDDSEVVLQWANKTINHEFDYLGSGLIQLDPIDWHRDFKSNFTWPKGKFYLSYSQVDLSNHADVKVPWELSRCHHMLWLGEAYLIAKDEKFAKELVDQLECWIDENPLMYSINWTCAMDVAIRAVNWMYAVNMISGSEALNDSVIKKIQCSLFEHGWFIFNNLEKWYPYSANHYAANIAGLLYLGQLFQDSRGGKKWWDYALKEYFLEVRFQVLPSGAHFERSLSYHRLMTELFAYPYFMLQRVNEPIPLDITLRIQSMFQFIDHYTKPNGLAPQLGDSDDGRLLPFVKRDFRAHDYLLRIGIHAFETWYESLSTDDMILDIFLLLPSINHPNKGKRASIVDFSEIKDHRDAGFVILKKFELYLLFSNTSVSCYPDFHKNMFGTHTHADGLSFELSVGKQDFIIDPGTYVYTASAVARNTFRSTRMHNTLTIDGHDHVKLLAKDLFSVNDFYEVETIEIIRNEKEISLSGARKWKLPAGDTSHFRRILLRNNTEIDIIDKIFCGNQHDFKWHFYLAPGIHPELVGNDNVVLKGPDDLIINLSFESLNGFYLELLECEISPSYGVLHKSKVIRINLTASVDFSFKTATRIIYPKY